MCSPKFHQYSSNNPACHSHSFGERTVQLDNQPEECDAASCYDSLVAWREKPRACSREKFEKRWLEHVHYCGYAGASIGFMNICSSITRGDAALWRVETGSPAALNCVIDSLLAPHRTPIFWKSSWIRHPGYIFLEQQSGVRSGLIKQTGRRPWHSTIRLYYFLVRN